MRPAGDADRHRVRARFARVAAPLLAALVLGACASRPPSAPSPAPEPAPGARELDVTAHAYTSSASETDGQPALAASGRTLRPGMRAIAVSEDLLAMGLDYGTRVSIDGHGEWVVLDRMNGRHRRAIDLYMGDDRDAALAFGKRRVKIRWSAR